jgi:hypothetical protein
VSARSFLVAAVVGCASLVGCAPVPRPQVLSQADEVGRGPQADEAKSLAPQAFAHAEKLRGEAKAAFDAGDLAGSQILGERAIAAYAHAGALARIARADQSEADAKKKTAALDPEASALDGEQLRVGAEADALELKVKVTRDAQAVVPSGPADAARERARLAAARSLVLEAKLLCGAAKLLAAKPAPAPAPPSPDKAAPADKAAPDPAADVDAAAAEALRLDEALAAPKGTIPIDHATRARARCLAALTQVRRAATPVTKAPGAGDALLAELSAAGSWSPSRDDRGVVVTLRSAGKGAGLAKDTEARLTALGRIAASHPSFPVEVVLHTEKDPGDKERAEAQARAEAAAKLVRAGRADRVEALVAGARAPVVDPRGRDKARNARIEVVFVTPEAF